MAASITYPEAVKFLYALIEGVPDDQCLEIRTLKPGGGGKKNFYSLATIRQQGLETALHGHLDGKENVYYGVAPRFEARQAESEADRGDAVNLATTLWLDEITRPAPDLPPFSWIVETSVGKVQAGYLLKEPATDIDRVERLNLRLGVAVGGDNVWNRGRILRLPGFINLNHPGGQRARLIEFHPDLRYTLDELDLLLPQLPQEQVDGRRAPGNGQYQPGTFDPHGPCPLPPALQDRLADFFQGLNLRRCADGRFGGACPLPHGDNVACDCERAFYASPVSGSWSCFCSDHVGQSSGTVRAFALLGFSDDLTQAEIEAEIGKYHLGPGEVRRREGGSETEDISKRADVAARVITQKPLYRRSDKPKDRGKRSGLWAEAKRLFPIPTHVKPRVKGYLLWSERNLKGLAVDLFSNTWRNNANAQYKRQKLYFNILPRINGPQIYQRRVPIDDWDSKGHKRISRAIQRASTQFQGWLWFDNALKRGYVLYLTDVAGLAGFEPIEDVIPILIDALKSIHPPDRQDDEGRFHPYGGSRNWKSKAEDTGEEDSGRWEIIAVAQGPTDFVGVEAECVVSGVKTEFVPPYWRGQPYQGLSMHHQSKESFVAFVQGFPDQYTLTKAGVAAQPQEVA